MLSQPRATKDIDFVLDAVALRGETACCSLTAFTSTLITTSSIDVFRKRSVYVLRHFRAALPYTCTFPSTATGTNLFVSASLNCTT